MTGARIRSRKNRQVAAAARLKKRAFRERDRRFLVEGESAVEEALVAGALDQLFVVDESGRLAMLARQRNVPVFVVTEPVLAGLASTVSPQGSIGVARFVDVPLTGLGPAEGCVAMLCDCRDPGNAGTILRSADAAGAHAVILTTGSVDVYNPKTVRATAGSLFHVPVVRQVSVAEAAAHLRARGYRLVAASAHGTENLWEAPLEGPVAFLFGNEAWGLSKEAAAIADRSVGIPIASQAESLNLASAASICLFEWVRRASSRTDGVRPEVLAALIDAAAHDLRAPVAGIKSFVSTLTHGVDRDTARLLLDGITYDADRMDLVIAYLLDAARLAAGTVQALPEPIDVGAVVAKLAEAQARNPDFPEVRWVGEMSSVRLDPARLRAGIASLVEAARWYASTGPIEISAVRRGHGVRIMVERAGADVGPEEIATLFDFRPGGRERGSRLPLFVTRQVAVALGGGVSASVEGGVLRLCLELPEAD